MEADEGEILVLAYGDDPSEELVRGNSILWPLSPFSYPLSVLPIGLIISKESSDSDAEGVSDGETRPTETSLSDRSW
jgi:hypothetical protein